MKIRAITFIEFAYGDKRRDRSKVREIVESLDSSYDPAKDRYKQFRDSLKSLEDGRISTESFLSLSLRVSANKSSGYGVLCKNYLNLKEDFGLIWEGRSPIEADMSGLRVSTSWYLRTDTNNRRIIVFINLRKDQLPRNKERGLLTLLRLAKPDSAGVGILNIQPGTLITAPRLDQNEADYLHERAARFMALAKET